MFDHNSDCSASLAVIWWWTRCVLCRQNRRELNTSFCFYGVAVASFVLVGRRDCPGSLVPIETKSGIPPYGCIILLLGVIAVFSLNPDRSMVGCSVISCSDFCSIDLCFFCEATDCVLDQTDVSHWFGCDDCFCHLGSRVDLGTRNRCG